MATTTRISGKTELLGADIQNNDVLLIEHDVSGEDVDKKIKFSTLKTKVLSDLVDGTTPSAKATADASGNDIASTYATQSALADIVNGTEIDSFADVETALSGIQNGQSINNFGGVETALSSKVSTSQTAGLLKNDGTVDTNSYVQSSELLSKADLADIANAFVTTKTYTVGQYVTYNNDIYRCTVNHSGTWNNSHFTKISVVNELTARPSFDETTWKRLTGADGENGIFELNINTQVTINDPNVWYESTVTITGGHFDWFDSSEGEHLDFNVKSLYATVGTTDEAYPATVWIKPMTQANKLKFAVKVDSISYCKSNQNVRFHLVASVSKHD